MLNPYSILQSFNPSKLIWGGDIVRIKFVLFMFPSFVASIQSLNHSILQSFKINLGGGIVRIKSVIFLFQALRFPHQHHSKISIAPNPHSIPQSFNPSKLIWGDIVRIKFALFLFRADSRSLPQHPNHNKLFKHLFGMRGILQFVG
ncbi:hypothetical protein BDD43_1808 [Mucilaginibacter gracilis]|uniref:Uncharacterized protein n=1 Tax=Mucilaginibacter gracilis TaxID=423350 RepID=A0A495IZW5_9SPHI|nr:hypothetical protein BDD43_1808 [Mucilaginibacter gracilis]